MIVSLRMPRSALMAQAGIVPVATKNNGDPTAGRVPLRNIGDVLAEMTLPEFADSKVRNFHRYASVDLIGSFDTEANASSAAVLAERQLRLNPAPGVLLPDPLDKALNKDVYLGGIFYLGTIVTHWDSVSRSVINVTTPNHDMRDGFVVRQVTALGRNVYVTTYGEGVNTGPLHAWANGTFGPNPCFEMDEDISAMQASAPGFPACRPAGRSGIGERV